MSYDFLDDTLDGDYSKPLPPVTDRLQKYLKDGQIISFHTKYLWPIIGDQASIGEQPLPDGYYRLRDEATRFLIQDSRVAHEYYIDRYTNRTGLTIEVDGSRINGIVRGSLAWDEDAPAPDGWYHRAWFSRVHIRDGRVIQKVF